MSDKTESISAKLRRWADEREREAYDRRMSVAGAKAPCNASAIAGIMRRADAIAWDARSIIGTSEAKGA